jgi:hypothetical protein
VNESRDTADKVARLVADRYRSMSPIERVLIVCSMNATARVIVESSLPPSLTREQRRLAVARRFYGTELPEAALLAHANHVADGR